MKKRVFGLLAAVAVLVSACSGGNAGSGRTGDTAAPVEETDAEEAPADGENTTENSEANITSTELDAFDCAFFETGVDETALKAYAPWDVRDIAGVGYRFVLEETESGEVECRMTVLHVPQDADDTEQAGDDEAITCRFTAAKKDLDALQALLASHDLIKTYCNYYDVTEGIPEESISRMYAHYASEEEATHTCNNACRFSLDDRLLLHDFFYGLLEEYDVIFYGRTDQYDDTVFTEAYLAAAPWEPLTAPDGRALTLEFGEGRTFSLHAGADDYAGSFKDRVTTRQEYYYADILNMTLTTWPVEWEQMMTGGTVDIDIDIVCDELHATGEEKLIVIRREGTESIFDPYFGEDNDRLVFTRPYTGYFQEKSALPLTIETMEIMGEEGLTSGSVQFVHYDDARAGYHAACAVDFDAFNRDMSKTVEEMLGAPSATDPDVTIAQVNAEVQVLRADELAVLLLYHLIRTDENGVTDRTVYRWALMDSRTGEKVAEDMIITEEDTPGEETSLFTPYETYPDGVPDFYRLMPEPAADLEDAVIYPE